MLTKITTALCRVPTFHGIRLRLAWRRKGWSTENPSPISFSQCHEDMVVQALVGKVHRLIDVGANDGVTYSNTCKFILDGAEALLIEPESRNFSRLVALHRGQNRVECVRAALSDKKGTVALAEDGLFSTIEPSSNQRRQTVPCEPLSDVVTRRPAFRTVDFLSIDVEGHELGVLNGIPFTQFTARCIVLETHDGTHPDWATVSGRLREHGYTEVLRNPLNSYFLHATARPITRPMDIAQKVANHWVPAAAQ